MDHRLNEVIISLTSRCNLRCAMCQIHSSDGNGELSSVEMRRLIDDAILLCPRTIVFSGGEPLLRDDIFDLISHVSRQRINTSLTSNGTLLTDEVARKLSLAGIGGVNISIEGDEKTHDRLRGSGNYSKAVEALKSLAKHNIETTIASTVSRFNYAVLPQTIELAHRFKATTVRFQPFSLIFLKDKKIGDKFFVPVEFRHEIERSIAEVIRLAREYRITINPEPYLNNIPAYLCGESVINVSQKGCSALWSSCPISAEGNVLPCWVLSDRVIGNVKSRRLSEVWGSQEHDHLRRDIEKSGCGGCMMSCYDQNFGKPELGSMVALKVQKLGKTSFYRRMYNSVYQSVRYALGKVANKVRVWSLMRRSAGRVGHAELLKETKAAKESLHRKLKGL